MIRCQNCGQGNSDGSNFCRSCGIKFTPVPRNQPQRQPQSQKIQPPLPQRRPYSWKTDEFAVEKETPSARSTQPIDPPVFGVRGNQNVTAPIHKEAPKHAIQNRQATAGNMVSHGYRCPRCATQMLPQVTKKISSAGWIVFAILLVAFFPLFWIGFLIKEEVRVCPVCSVELR